MRLESRRTLSIVELRNQRTLNFNLQMTINHWRIDCVISKLDDAVAKGD